MYVFMYVCIYVCMYLLSVAEEKGLRGHWMKRAPENVPAGTIAMFLERVIRPRKPRLRPRPREAGSSVPTTCRPLHALPTWPSGATISPESASLCTDQALLWPVRCSARSRRHDKAWLLAGSSLVECRLCRPRQAARAQILLARLPWC